MGQNCYGESIKNQSAYTLIEASQMVGAILRYSRILIEDTKNKSEEEIVKLLEKEKALLERDIPEKIREPLAASINYLEEICLNKH